jgi:hypothetical protein
MSGDVTFRYNTNLANYKGIAPGELVVDAGTLITLAKADLSGAQLDLLFRSGRDVVITSTIRTEATSQDFPDATTIANWINRNHNNPHLIIDESPLNPAFVPRSDNGEKSIIGYIQRTGGDIRVVTEDIEWMNGHVQGLAAARDLAGTSGVNLTTNEFVNDLMLSGSISPFEHSFAAFQILKANRNTVEEQNVLFKVGQDIQIEDQEGNAGHVLYGGPLGAIAFDAHGIPIGLPAIFGARLNIPKSSPLKLTEADDSDGATALAYGSVETVNGKLTMVGLDTDHSTALQQAKFEYDPSTGTMTKSLVKDDGTSTKTVFDTGAQPWSSETSAFDAYQRLQSQRVVFDGGSQQVKQYDPNNTRPYDELDIDEDASGKPTAVKPKLDGQPATADFSAIGQVFGSAIGRAIVGKDANPFVSLTAGTIAGFVGQKFVQALINGPGAIDLASVDIADVFFGKQVSLAGAGLGAAASFLTAELATSIGLNGVGAQMFNAAVGGYLGSVLNQVRLQGFAVLTSGIDWNVALHASEINIASTVGSLLAHQFVPPESQFGAVGGQLAGAIGSALAYSFSVGLSTALNVVFPGIGAFFGTIIGTIIGDAIAGDPAYPKAFHDVEIIGSNPTHFQNRLFGTDDHGNAAVSQAMGDQVTKIANSYLDAVHGAAIDASGKVMTGYNAGAAPYQYKNRRVKARRTVRAGGWRREQRPAVSMTCAEKSSRNRMPIHKTSILKITHGIRA